MIGLTGAESQIILALIALVSLSLTTLVWVIHNGRNVRVAADEATAANRAVNNVGEGEHKMYDMVKDIKTDLSYVKADVASLKADQEVYDAHGWETLPSDIGTAVGLTMTIRTLQANHKSIESKLDQVLRLLAKQSQSNV